MTEYKAFFKKVKAGEGDRCHYPTRLDPYGCGCQHDCAYCYAKSLLEFRNLWNPCEPRVADIEKIRRVIRRIPKNTPAIRLGGMTDPFQPLEQEHAVTLQTILLLNEARIPYLIVTKSDLVADYVYRRHMDKNLAHIQITVTCTDDEQALTFEHASVPSKRLQALRTLQDDGFKVQLRLSPYLENNIDPAVIRSYAPQKAVVEFLRVNHWILKWFPVDENMYSVECGGYRHLPLSVKQMQIARLQCALPNTRITVCEDETEAYEYWKHNFNPNPDDCCDL